MEKENVRSGSAAMTELTPQEEQKLKELTVDYFEGNPLGLPPRLTPADVIEGMREARNAALEEAARIADRHVAADQELQNRAVDPQMVTIAILTGRIIARDIRALALPDSKPDRGGA